MKLISRRKEYGQNYTISELSVNDVYECFVLEDTVRAPGIKIAGATAIPAGTYKVVIDMSTRFGRDMPHILDVPGFAGIRIHSGNDSADTEGCLLVGTTWAGSDFIGNSRVAFDHFFPQIQAALAAEESVTIEIQDTK
jgi:hypothetical protein